MSAVRTESPPSLLAEAAEALGQPSFVLRRSAASDFLKRSLDIVLCVLGAIISAPLWMLAITAILLEDGGPVLYRQRRWGLGGRTFRVWKFRTMVNGADSDGVLQAKPQDGRITKVGRVLRSCGLDELPQLINIIVGEMSLVGPRALAVGEILHSDGGGHIGYEDVPGFSARMSVRPGLTGMAAIYLSKDAAPIEKFAYDLKYIEERTLLLDIKLIILSVWISVTARWERRSSKLGRSHGEFGVE